MAVWRCALDRGLLPDDAALAALVADPDSPFFGYDPESLSWPAPPLRTALIRDLARLGAPRFCAKYSAVMDAMLKTLLEAAQKYEKAVHGYDEWDGGGWGGGRGGKEGSVCVGSPAGVGRWPGYEAASPHPTPPPTHRPPNLSAESWKSRTTRRRGTGVPT